MLTERAARHPRDEDVEHAKRMVVAPSFARLERQRKFGQPAQPLLSAHRRRLRTGLRAVRCHRLLQRRSLDHHAVPGSIGQEVANRDGPASRHGVVELSSWTAQHLTVSQFRQPARQTLVEPQTPCLYKTECGDRRNRLGHGLDPHDRVLAHQIPADGRHARCDHLGVAGIQQRDPARNRPGVNVTNQQVLHGVLTSAIVPPLTARIKPPPTAATGTGR